MYRRLRMNRAFTFYFASRMLSKAGTSMSGITFLLLVYGLTHSGVQTTGVALAETGPYALFGLIGGVAADRLPQKSVLVILDVAQGLILTAGAALYTVHELTYPLILAIAFLVETAGCFYNPASRSVLPVIISAEDNVAANSLVDISSRGTQLIGPAAVYFLLRQAGYGTFLFADAVSYVASAGLLLWMTVPATSNAPTTPTTPTNPATTSTHSVRNPPRPRLSRSLYQPIADFARFAWRAPGLRRLFLLTTLVVFFNTWVWQVGLLLNVESLFNNGRQIYSLYLICFSVFSIIVSLTLPLRFKSLNLSHYVLGAALWGAGVLGMGITHQASVMAGSSILVGIGMTVAGLSRVYVLQKQVPGPMRGRAFSFSAVLLYCANIASLLLFGALSRLIPVPVLFDISGVGMIVVAGLHLVVS